MINNNYYNIVYTRIAVLLLPSFLRNKIYVPLVTAMASPLDNIHLDFVALKSGIDFNTYSQVCTMQGLINDYFDPLERRIKIRNTTLDQDYYLFWKEQKIKPVLLKKDSSYMLARDFEIGTTHVDFEVVLPEGYILSENEEIRLTNLVNQSKLASKRYKITNGQD